MDLIIRNASIAKMPDPMDIGIEKGRIVEISKKIREKTNEEIDAAGNLVSPGFVECHMHLDKAFTAEGGKLPKFNSEEEIAPPKLADKDQIEQIYIDIGKRNYHSFTVENVKERAIKCAEMAICNGITALRTFVDINSDVGLTGFKGVLEAKKALKDKVYIQIVAFPQYGYLADPPTEDLIRDALKSGADLCGGHAHDASGPLGVDKSIDITFQIAKEFDVDIDSHIGTYGNFGTYNLERFAWMAIQNGLQGRITASIASALGRAPKESVFSAIKWIKEANVKVVPVYVFLQSRFPLKELLDAGITVGTGGDNTRDWFNPFGTTDILGAMMLSFCDQCKCNMRSNERMQQVFDMITYGGAKVLGIDKDYGLKTGKLADLIILEAPSPQWAIIRQCRKLYTIKNGKIVAKNGEMREHSK